MLPYRQAAAARGVARLACVLPAARRLDSCLEGGAAGPALVGGGAAQAKAQGSAAGESAGAGVTSHVYADASGEGGWAAWTVADGELLYVYGEWTEDERELLIICEKELLASTWGLVAFAPWLQQGVVSWTDNTVAMEAMRSMAPRTEGMQAIIRRLQRGALSTCSMKRS